MSDTTTHHPTLQLKRGVQTKACEAAKNQFSEARKQAVDIQKKVDRYLDPINAPQLLLHEAAVTWDKLIEAWNKLRDLNKKETEKIC